MHSASKCACAIALGKGHGRPQQQGRGEHCGLLDRCKTHISPRSFGARISSPTLTRPVQIPQSGRTECTAIRKLTNPTKVGLSRKWLKRSFNSTTGGRGYGKLEI